MGPSLEGESACSGTQPWVLLFNGEKMIQVAVGVRNKLRKEKQARQIRSFVIISSDVTDTRERRHGAMTIAEFLANQQVANKNDKD